MPIRTASVSRKIKENGRALHRAMAERIEAHGEAHAPSEAERALLEARRLVKEDRAQRAAQAADKPRLTQADKLLRTHRPVAKARPEEELKAAKAARAHAKDAKGAKGGKPGADAGQGGKPGQHHTRAEKHAAKAAALDAARRAPKKPAKG